MLQHIPTVDLPRPGSEPKTISETPTETSKPLSPEQEKRRSLAQTATARLFDLLPPLDVGDPQSFLAQVVAIFEQYPPRVMLTAIYDPVLGIPARSDRPTLKFIREACEAIYAPILRELEREDARLQASRCRALPAPPRTPEQQARIDEQVEDARKRLGIPAGGFKRDKFIARPSDDAANPIAATAPADGKHALRVASDLAQRRPIP